MTEPVAKKSDRRKQTIIVGTSLLGLVLTYAIFKHSSAASSAATDTSGGGVAGSTDSSIQDALAQNTGALSALQNGVSFLTDALTGSGGGSGTDTTTPPPANTNPPPDSSTIPSAFSSGLSGVLQHIKLQITNDKSHGAPFAGQAAGEQEALNAWNPALSFDSNYQHIQNIITNDNKHQMSQQASGAAAALALLTPLHSQQGHTTTPTAA